MVRNRCVKAIRVFMTYVKEMLRYAAFELPNVIFSVIGSGS